MRRRFDPSVYVALKDAGNSNAETARKLGVDEASVRRGLKAAGYRKSRLRTLLLDVADELDARL